jgi:hypothetical protein
LAALGLGRLRHVPGTDTDANTGDRTYLVLAKPNVIMNDIRLRGLGFQAVTLPVARAPTTTPRPLGTSNGPSRTRPLVPG